MKLVRFAKAAFIGDHLHPAGSEALLPDDVPLNQYMTDLSSGDSGPEPAQPDPVNRSDLGIHAAIPIQEAPESLRIVQTEGAESEPPAG